MQSLAVKYRPKTFDEVIGQEVTIQILLRQLETKQFPNCYLFTGPSGDGKTTIARIMANKINNGLGRPIELDAASNNGIDNVRELIAAANERSLDSEYKIIILDEAHMITGAGWNAFLKCIEETPKYTIFMFCTTDPQKIPLTILNRCMRFNLSRVDENKIIQRLRYICTQENYFNYNESLPFIASLANGSVREAIANLEKASFYSPDLNIENVNKALGKYSYSIMFELLNAIIDRKISSIINIVEDAYNSGKDLKFFIGDFLKFLLDINKYCIFEDINVTKIPANLIKDVQNVVNVYETKEQNLKFYNSMVNQLLNIKNSIKEDNDAKSTIEIMLMNIANS